MNISNTVRQTSTMLSCVYTRKPCWNLETDFWIYQCVARKVPDLCKAYTPGKADQDLSVRLSRIEHIIEMALPQFCAPGTPNSSSLDASVSHERRRSLSVTEDDARSQTEEQDPSGGTFQSGKWYGNSASGSVAPASVLEQVCLCAMHPLLY
jgi:hypothetical protein